MGRKNVPVKTKEGTQEIRARSLGLAPRIRTALLLVDGIKSAAELESLMAAAGVTPGALQLLIDKGLIRFPEEEPAPVQEVMHAAPAPSVASHALPALEAQVEPTFDHTPQPPSSPEAAQATPYIDAPTILEMRLQKTILQVPDPEPEPEPEPIPEPEAIPEPQAIPEPVSAPVSRLVPKPISKPLAGPAMKPKAQSASASGVTGRPQVETLIELPKPRVAKGSPTNIQASAQVVDMMPPFPAPRPPRMGSAPLEVVTLLELETILGGATKMEVATILGVATMLELTPTQMMAPRTAVKMDPHDEPRLPPLAHAERARRVAQEAAPKLVLPAAVLRMNLMAARAHLAAALDQFVEIEGYALKQKLMACEVREDLEHLFGAVEAVLVRKIKKPAISSLIATANNILDR